MEYTVIYFFFAQFISRLRISIDFYSSLNDANLCLSLNTGRNGQQTLQIISLKNYTHCASGRRT